MRHAVEREQAADGVLADVVGEAPRRAVVEEFEARFRAGGEAGISLDAALELGLEGRVFGEVFAGQLFQHVGLAVLALLENGVEEAPADGGIGRLGLQPVDGDLRQALVEGNDDRAGGEGHFFRGQRALAEAAGLGSRAFAGKDGMAAFEGRTLPLHSAAAIALHFAGPRRGGAAHGHVVGSEHVDHARPLGRNDVGGGRGGRGDDLVSA